jgi:hypothetical protein
MENGAEHRREQSSLQEKELSLSGEVSLWRNIQRCEGERNVHIAGIIIPSTAADRQIGDPKFTVYCCVTTIWKCSDRTQWLSLLYLTILWFRVWTRA